MLKQKIFYSLGVLGAGAILPLAFAPFSYYWLAEIALVGLLLIWSNTKSAKLTFLYGWLFGVAFFGCGIYWIYISVYNFGHAPLWLALFIMMLLISFLALYPALQGYLLNRFYPQNNWYKFLLAFPATWVILEWIRGWFLSGLPWLFLGYSHIDTPLRGWATIFGVYGVSFLVAQIAGIIICIFYYRKKIKLVTIFTLLFIAFWSIGYWLTKIIWVEPNVKPIQVSLIQGNIALERKWNHKELNAIFNSYADLTKQNFSSQIIVWPEAGIPDFPENVNTRLQRLATIARKHGTAILAGVPFYEIQDNCYYNGMLMFGANDGRYYKRHLVPFGEYLPLRFALNWLHKYLEIPMADFSSGAKNQNELLVGWIVLAPFVCYEIAYANLVLDYLPRANLLVTVSDDSWFGESIAAAQHLEIARMRSLEVGRYQLLSTNTGITAVIDYQGRIVTQVPRFKQAVLTAEVQPLVGATPWVKFGRYIWLLLLVLLLGIAWWKNKSKNVEVRKRL